jgi:hypothetical protein
MMLVAQKEFEFGQRKMVVRFCDAYQETLESVERTFEERGPSVDSS